MPLQVDRYLDKLHYTAIHVRYRQNRTTEGSDRVNVVDATISLYLEHGFGAAMISNDSDLTETLKACHTDYFTEPERRNRVQNPYTIRQYAKQLRLLRSAHLESKVFVDHDKKGRKLSAFSSRVQATLQSRVKKLFKLTLSVSSETQWALHNSVRLLAIRRLHACTASNPPNHRRRSLTRSERRQGRRLSPMGTV